LDQVKFNKLISVADKQEQTTLKVLYNAVVKCINDLNANSTAVSVKDWEATKNSYEQYTEKLWGKYFPAAAEEYPPLDNILAVVEYLTAAGWRIKKSTAYKHHKDGILRPGSDGKYSRATVDKYAATKLKRLDGTKKDQIEKLNEARQKAETRKLQAQAEHWELKSKIAQGQYVPKDTFERELARRAMVFKTDMEAFCRSQAGAVIGLVGGDKDRTPDLTEYLLAEFAKWLARYAADREFVVPAPEAEDILPDPDEDEPAD
jgi:hypothetical protein